ncbi:MAG: tetratricopeptide repeat protein [Caulobacterales bacterium]
MSEFQRAFGLFQNGDLAGAEKALRALVAKTPADANALHLLGGVLHARGRSEAALQWFERAGKFAPQDLSIAFNHANVLAALGRHEEAVAAFDRVLKLAPRDGEALYAQGASYLAIRRHEEALACFDAATALGVRKPDMQVNRGAALAALKRHQDALDIFDAALAQTPNDMKAHYNRGAALIDLDRYEDALAAFERALAIDPNYPEARAGRGSALGTLGRTEEALAEIGAALAGAKVSPDCYRIKAQILLHANMDGVEENIDRFIAARPEDADAPFTKAVDLLARGAFREGWRYYESRWGMTKSQKPLAASLAPLWLGEEDIAGKSVVVIGEQGFGDCFQFCRFVTRLAERGADVILQERASTLGILRSLKGVRGVYASSEPAPLTDYHIPMGSLMRALAIHEESDVRAGAYLFAASERVAHWRDILGPARRKRVGIIWEGNVIDHRQRQRALDMRWLSRLLEADVDFINLKLGLNAEATAVLENAGARMFGDATKEFSELAALIEALDMVIAIDTGVAHLSGALGKETWVLLPFHADWRWMRERTDSPWYPSTRLFRQQRYGDWSDPIEAAMAALRP